MTWKSLNFLTVSFPLTKSLANSMVNSEPNYTLASAKRDKEEHQWHPMPVELGGPQRYDHYFQKVVHIRNDHPPSCSFSGYFRPASKRK